MRQSVYLIIVLLAAILCQQAALADCSTRSGNSTFGSISSFALAATAQTVESSSGFICSGSLLSLISTNTVTATIASSAHANGNQPQLFSAKTGSYVPYTICADTGCDTTYHTGGTITWRSTTLLGLLGLFNSSDGTLPLYLRTATGVNVPAGTYTDTITLNWTYHICFVGVLGVCVYTDGTATSTVNVTLNVSDDCYIDNAPDLNFGSAALPELFSVVSNALSVRCTSNASYSVNLSGSNPVMNGWRQMTGSAGGDTPLMQYQLYKADGSVWGNDNNLSAVGNGMSQSFPYSARINPDQRGLPAGTYSETITVTVSY